ncbi:MAG: hypothetical protein OEZ43_02065 [Gammaproteobacteria bacterium]|nr:hypothetical protein [Gammaproteobacteria bacterium]
MAEFFQNLPDGWTIYVWLVVAAGILIAAGFMLRWAAKNDQFDEDIKYVVFDEKDKDKMDPEEFQKSVEVQAAQEKLRKEYLAKKKSSK